MIDVSITCVYAEQKMARVTKRYIYKAEDNQLNIQFTNYIRPSLQFMPFRYTVVKITRLGFDEYKTYTTNILQLDSLIEHCEQILYISETFDLAGQMTETYVSNAVYNIRISRFPNTRTTFTVVNGEPGIRGLILDTRYMKAIKKAVRYCNELGGNMARFTQFPIMITRSTIIYEIISPGAAGSSIYV